MSVLVNLLTEENLEKSNKVATESIFHGLKHNSPSLLNPSKFSSDLHVEAMTFVSIELKEKQLGCRGNLSNMPLFLSISRNAFNSAFRDTRYPILTKNMCLDCDFKIYYLYGKVTYYNITKNELMLLLKADDSVSITNGYKSGFYLNTIQKNFNNKIDFTNALLEKANLSIDYDFDNLEVNTYKTIEGRKFKLKEYMEIQNEA
jgi:AMMECR1 domain-containing protein